MSVFYSLKLLFEIVKYYITVAVEEENEMDGSDLLGNQFDKLGTLQKHLIRHRELFLSRQVETYKIDMVRSVQTAHKEDKASVCNFFVDH